MKPERWQQIEALFQRALEHDSAERSGFLDQACAGDQSLRREVEVLIAAHEKAGSFIESPAFEVEARDLADEARQATDDSVKRAAALIAGQSISHYRIIEQLGEGGMGEVYLAQDTRLGRQIALKLLPAQFTRDAERVRRFEQEARAASALNHPNIVTIHEIAQVDSSHFIATEFIEGVTLRQHMTAARMKLGEVLDIAAQVASALAAAHAAGIVHRDIKPENIMVRTDGYVKVLDFGLAKLTERQAFAVDTEAATRALVQTHPGMVIGTVTYMSPEQARGRAVDARTDIWSLGVVLYEMVAGRVPFAGETPSDVIVSTLERESPPLACYSAEVPAELERIVDKALRKNREERYQTVKDLYLDLRNLKQELEVEARLERSLQSHASGREAATDSGGQAAAAAIGRESAARTADVGVAHPTSSAEYLVSEIKRHKRGVVVGLVTTVLALVTVVVVLSIASHSWISRPPKQPETSAAPVRSIAVLPFKSLSSDASDDYLGLGMADTLITRLSSMNQIVVRQTSAVRKFISPDQDPVAAGRELKVDAVLETSMQRVGDRIRVNLRLVRVSDGSSLWTGKVEEQVNDTFAVQDRVAEQVARALVPQLTGNEKNLLAKHYTQNPEAHDLYMRGRYQWYTSATDPAKKERAIKFFNQAIEKDPDFALAYSALADTYMDLASDAPPTETMPKAKEAALKALRIDDTLSDSHRSLGIVKAYYEWDWAGAEQEFKRAIDLNPNSPEAHSAYGRYLTVTGRNVEALAEMKRSQELGDPPSATGLLFALAGAHQYDRLIEEGRKMEPNAYLHSWMGVAYSEKGMHAEAIAELQKAASLSRGATLMKAQLGHAYAVAGRRAEAENSLSELKALAGQRYVSPYDIALIYVGLGDKEQAFAWLEKAYQERARRLWALKVNPSWDSLRSDSRFADLLRRIGLPQ
jgi:serine/threonine protein kinase/Flp pilus assembly protein TadD